MNVPLLRRLRDAGGSFVAPETIGPDPAALARDLLELEAFGFRFERDDRLGVAFASAPDRLCPDWIEEGLETARIGRRVAVWERVSSTSDIAARASGSRRNDGLVVLAESQTAGRGRRGRTWVAPTRTSILMSVLVFPPDRRPDGLAWLTALGALAASEVVEAFTGRPARIKWPNDVRVEGLKVAGILVERGPGAVLGIGLNANHDPADVPPDIRARSTSLRALLGRPVDRSEVARSLILRLDALYDRAVRLGPRSLVEPWRDCLEASGRWARVETEGGTVSGRLIDADFERGLTLCDAGGGTARVACPAILALDLAEDFETSI